MRLVASKALLLSALLSVNSHVYARPCPNGECSENSLLPRLELPDIILPKPIEGPKPIAPAPPAPKPLVPVPAVPAPKPIVPDPAPEPKPEDPSPPKPFDPAQPAGPPPLPAAPACKREPGGCVGYTFSNIDYVQKGKDLIARFQKNLENPPTNDHDFSNQLKTFYTVRSSKKEAPISDPKIRTFIKDTQGIDLGGTFTADTSWTKYEVFGTKDMNGWVQPSIAEVFVSVKYKAMIPTRLFRKENDLYKGIELADRLPMSEWLFQIWKTGVEEGLADYGVQIGIGDLQKIIGVDVNNADTKAIVAKAQADLAAGEKRFIVKPDQADPWNAFAYSSSGISKYNMLRDHDAVAELNGLKPSQIDVSLEDESSDHPPAIIWTLTRGSG